MFGYGFPHVSTPTVIPPAPITHAIVFCNTCACSFLDSCPNHPTVPVKLGSGEKGFQIAKVK